jgi:hypothetical protein
LDGAPDQRGAEALGKEGEEDPEKKREEERNEVEETEQDQACCRIHIYEK